MGNFQVEKALRDVDGREDQRQEGEDPYELWRGRITPTIWEVVKRDK